MRRRRPCGRLAESITAVRLRDLFAAHVLRGHLRMPADAELKELARVLEGWRLIFQNERDQDFPHLLQREALAALRTLSDVCSKIAELDISNLHAAVHDSARAGVLRILNERAAAINDVCRKIVAIEGSSAWNSRTMGFGGWKWLADAARVDFARAMKPANPSFALAYKAPLARYIAAVAPLLTGEHPTAASIATQLKMRRKARRQAHRENLRRLSTRVK